MYFSIATFDCNKLWKNSLEGIAIRVTEGHSDLEHIVSSWQENDAVMKLWDASATAMAVWLPKEYIPLGLQKCMGSS